MLKETIRYVFQLFCSGRLFNLSPICMLVYKTGDPVTLTPPESQYTNDIIHVTNIRNQNSKNANNNSYKSDNNNSDNNNNKAQKQLSLFSLI